MANVWFIGDGHFGHRNILKFRNQFKTIEEHDATIIDAINASATKRDKIFLMGDWIFDEGAIETVRRIKCPHKHLLLGNHDDYTLIPKMYDVVDDISGDIKYKEFWLSHIPIHPDELRGKFNIYAHTHNAKIRDESRYFCTSCEQISFKPVDLETIREHFRKKNSRRSLKKFADIWKSEE